MPYTSPIFKELERANGALLKKFIDCDFRDKGINNGNAVNACSPDSSPCGTYAPVLEEKAGFNLIPESEYMDRIEEMDKRGGGLDTLVVHVYDQGREGTCTSNQESQKGNIIDAMQYGKDNVVIRSPISIYMEVAPGPGTGSTVGENLVQHRTVGALPINNEHNKNIMGAHWVEKYSMTATGYDKKKYRDNWEDMAKNFRIDEYYDISTSGGILTAVFNDWPAGYGRSGHSILGLRPVANNGIVYLLYINSWGPWGLTLHGIKGFGLDSPSKYGSGARSYGCNCACSTVLPPWHGIQSDKKCMSSSDTTDKLIPEKKKKPDLDYKEKPKSMMDELEL